MMLATTLGQRSNTVTGGGGSKKTGAPEMMRSQTQTQHSSNSQPRTSLSRRASLALRRGFADADDTEADTENTNDHDGDYDGTKETTGGEVLPFAMNDDQMRQLNVNELGFSQEENDKIVHILCDFESGFSLMLDRIKQNMHSCKEVATFLKKRATIEEDYGRAMCKLSQSILNSKNDDGKKGSYSDAWKHTLSLHDQVGENRIKFAQTIASVAEEVSTLHKNTERSRKQLKEAGYKHWKAVHESENALEKAKSKYESCSEDWERAILTREQVIEGGSTMMMPNSAPIRGASGLAKSLSSLHIWKQATTTTNPAKVQKQEDDARTRAAIANENYKQQLGTTNHLRSMYFQTHLPRFIRMLLETNEACDHGLQTQLIKHAKDLEDALMIEAATLSPIDRDKIDSGIVKTMEHINNIGDFEQYMMAYFQNTKQLQKSDYQYSPYSMSPEAFSLAHPKPVFGLDLSIVCARDDVQVPTIVDKCIQAVEKYGLRTQGLYRVSAAHHAVQKLRGVLDKDVDKVNLDEWAEEISVVSSALKLYFRELPDSLFPKSMYHAFIDAAKIEDERMRLISIHELVNQLNDAHYSTLQALIGHLHNVQQLEAENRMGIQNLAIVWGPTLMDCPDASNFEPSELRLQSRVLETVLLNFSRIFEL
ncbi:RhoGAP-domain-containing protein [Rhizoclosmatium globosum]|uniref:RhoGAP-domain-containing protein n=1 Tax=Rhizoclosmatium globosum TaxID=329046 RepID=A0A1Y2BNG8_9FUNG|nr:RhoGAP-domain-containing protein [Rhizoclosmatium globosum]|eukprot:ORY36303.1 RhoGAP-domain-containing protein [Rhizoclosmatium globosum]